MLAIYSLSDKEGSISHVGHLLSLAKRGPSHMLAIYSLWQRGVRLTCWTFTPFSKEGFVSHVGHLLPLAKRGSSHMLAIYSLWQRGVHLTCWTFTPFSQEGFVSHVGHLLPLAKRGSSHMLAIYSAFLFVCIHFNPYTTESVSQQIKLLILRIKLVF